MELRTFLLLSIALNFAYGLSAQQVTSTNATGSERPVKRPAMPLHMPGHTPAANNSSERGGGAPNDLCTDIPIHAISTGSAIIITGNNTGATDTEDVGYNNVWEAFSISECANITIDYCGTTPAFSAISSFITQECPYVSIAGDANAGFGEHFTCADNNWTVCFRDLPAGTWYIPVYTAPGSTGPYSIDVVAYPCYTAMAPNDECANATELIVLPFCGPITPNNVGATQSLPAATCNGATGNANDDVWFFFVPTVPDMTLTINGTYDFDAVVEVFAGTCGALTSLGCGDATLEGGTEQLALTGFTVGAAYYARVYHYYTEDPCEPHFNICVVEGTGVNIGIEEQHAAGISVIAPFGSNAFTVVNDGPATSLEARLFDAAGRIVFAQRMHIANGQNTTVDLADRLAPGVHLLVIDDGVIRQRQRIMVQRQ